MAPRKRRKQASSPSPSRSRKKTKRLEEDDRENDEDENKEHDSNREKKAEKKQEPEATTSDSAVTHHAFPADILLLIPPLLEDLSTLRNLLLVGKRFYQILFPHISPYFNRSAVDGVSFWIDPDFNFPGDTWFWDGRYFDVGPWLTTSANSPRPIPHGTHQLYVYPSYDFTAEKTNLYQLLFGEYEQLTLQRSQIIERQKKKQQEQDQLGGTKRSKKGNPNIWPEIKELIVITKPHIVETIKAFFQRTQDRGFPMVPSIRNFHGGMKHGYFYAKKSIWDFSKWFPDLANDAAAQDASEIIQMYKYNQRHGEWNYLRSGNFNAGLFKIATYKDGELEGLQMSTSSASVLDNNEVIHNFFLIQDGAKQGEEWSIRNGLLASSSHYNEGIHSGIQQKWDYETGVRTLVCEYGDGKKVNQETKWTTAGIMTFNKKWMIKKNEKTKRMQSVQDGLCEEWWPNGSRKSSATYKEGVLEGEQQEWDRNGKRIGKK